VSLLARAELGDLPNLWHNQVSLHYSIHSTLPPHYTTESLALFNKTDCQGIKLDSTIPLFSSPIQIPTLNFKRDFRASQGWTARKLKRGGGVRGFRMLFITTQPKTCCKQEPRAGVALTWLPIPGMAPTNLNKQCVDLCKVINPRRLLQHNYFFPQ
jgi:hypothetical protein